jgi:2,4-dienoyl-CoA reductase-like NADH-dependent reductase (Old Yellow Enzyme family)
MADKYSRRDFLKKVALVGGVGLVGLRCQQEPSLLTPTPNKTDKLSLLFTPIKIGSINLKNRLVRSATAERMADNDGAVTDEMIALYEQLSKGDVGTIITGHTFVRTDGRLGMTMMGLDNDNLIKGITRLSKAVHQFDTKLFVQLNHAGIRAQPDIKNPLAPSAQQRNSPKEMTTDDIEQVVQSFGAAAKRAQEGGADGVQIHAAHGFLINQFLSPRTNKREDDWGGSPEKRVNFLLAVFKSIRKATGTDFPIWAKVNGEEFIQGGRALEECLMAAVKLAESGVNAIEISGLGQKRKTRYEGTSKNEPFYLTQAEQFRAKLKTPLILVGGIRNAEVIEMLLKEKGLDLVSMCRPFIREPDLPLKLQNKSVSESSCVSCSACARNNDVPIKCWQN